MDTKAKVVLVQSSYVHLDLQNLPEGGVQQFDNILYPNAAILLQSMVQTLVREPAHTYWALNLRS